METRPDDLTGMDPDSAREYVAAHIATLKLTEKKIAELDAEIAKWDAREGLARAKGLADLETAAAAEAARIKGDRARLAAEADEIKAQVERMRTQIPGLRARERSVDPDLLEQELLMAAGRMPGDEAAAETDRKMAELEKASSADDALAALKAKMAAAGGAS